MKRIYCTLFMVFITLKLLSQDNAYTPLLDIKCFPKLVKYWIEKKEWNLDSNYTMTDSLCNGYLSSFSIHPIGDTLLIIPNNYDSKNESNSVEIKVVADSDSSATVYLYMDNPNTFLKGKSTRLMKKKSQKVLNPITFKVLLKEDSSAIMVF